MTTVEYPLQELCAAWTDIRPQWVDLEQTGNTAYAGIVAAGDLITELASDDRHNGIIISFEADAENNDTQIGNLATRHFLNDVFEAAGFASDKAIRVTTLLKSATPDELRTSTDLNWNLTMLPNW